ncbi:RNA 2',3'-cyclic phosphodiesterase [Rhodocytophaga aerolata]|uniref:RNA 2',3'-cyclic phosphodiesterase n=1 Tax=Rhodocytophaga aerolata TaxID=455078 RepID=A0ABT8R9H8_9BACT|nr:RNA 2',3'-cyclic phosphodiesterase [Rhodocytophaga aerolata]MDO1448624.1 RNA 2',3'-cyclic phosphodiesterase [Rhodocytophaga aerolata]
MAFKRLFVALSIKERLKHSLEACRATLPIFGLAWVREENLHITVLFLGNIAEADIPAIQEKLQTLSNLKPFQLQCTHLVPVSKRGRLTMLWAGFAESQEFVRFATQLASLLNHPPDHSPLPHVTLARVRKGQKVKLHENQLPVFASHSWVVRSFGLWVSELNPAGAKYTILQEWELNG